MSAPVAACAAGFFMAIWPLVPFAEAPRPVLTLPMAFALAQERHPLLALTALERRVLEAEAAEAAFAPAMEAGLELENFAGTQALPGVRGAETTLTLGSILERGQKAEARQGVITTRMAATDTQQAARRLDVLAEVARRHLDWIEQISRCAIAEEAIHLREQAVTHVERRHQAGATPVSTLHTAEAQLALAQVAARQCAMRTRTAGRLLTAIWEDESEYQPATVSVLPAPTVPDEALLIEWLADSPELERFNDDARISAAELILGESARRTDFRWQVGIRRLEETDDTALVASVSYALGSAARAQPRIDAARARMEQHRVAQQAVHRTLRNTLLNAHGRLSATVMEVELLQDKVMPLLEKAEQAAREAFTAGAATYFEWSFTQNELLDVRERLLSVAASSHLALIEIQRLTAQPFTAHPFTAQAPGATR